MLRLGATDVLPTNSSDYYPEICGLGRIFMDDAAIPKKRKGVSNRKVILDLIWRSANKIGIKVHLLEYEP